MYQRMTLTTLAQIQYQTIFYELQAFIFSFWVILKKKLLQFVDVTENSDLIIEPVNNCHTITDFKDKKMRKYIKGAIKRKTQLDNPRTALQAPAAGSVGLLLPYFTLVSGLKSPFPLLSFFRSPTCLSSLPTCLETFVALLSRLIPAPIPESLVVLLSVFMLSPILSYLVFTALKTFK